MTQTELDLSIRINRLMSIRLNAVQLGREAIVDRLTIEIDSLTGKLRLHDRSRQTKS